MENFSINRDGQLDPEFVRQQRVQAVEHLATTALTDIQHFSAPLVRGLGNLASNVFTPLVLDLHDARHGSHLRDEWFDKKHQLATAAMRDEVGL